MANNLDQLKSKLSGDPAIDGLIWQDHFTYAAEYPFKNYINFSFDTSLIADDATRGVATVLPDSAKQAVRNALDYIHNLTGINFNEVPTGTTANKDLVFAFKAMGGAVESQDMYSYTFNAASSQVLDISDTILINSERIGANTIPVGSYPWQGLLHELGHALGLNDSGSNPIFPQQYNNGGATIMSQNNTSNCTSYSTLDINALNWLYNGNGLQNPNIVPTGTAVSGSWTLTNQNTAAYFTQWVPPYYA